MVVLRASYDNSHDQPCAHHFHERSNTNAVLGINICCFHRFLFHPPHQYHHCNNKPGTITCCTVFGIQQTMTRPVMPIVQKYQIVAPLKKMGYGLPLNLLSKNHVNPLIVTKYSPPKIVNSCVTKATLLIKFISKLHFVLKYSWPFQFLFQKVFFCNFGRCLKFL